jgi:regulator of cell morphogenesis and NO signaling
MDSFSPSHLLSELARRQPRWVGVLERHGIDCCQGPDRSLARACRDAGVDLPALCHEMQQADQLQVPHAANDWDNRSLQSLVRHIVEQHHVYLRRVFPSLGALVGKVTKRREGERAKYREIALLLAALKAELTSHMRKEEIVLFPWICELEATQTLNRTRCGTLQSPIHVMEDEHRFAVETLARIRWLADDLRPPTDACPTLRALYIGLEELECDLRLHIREEQDILFPRAIELEARCLQTS